MEQKYPFTCKFCGNEFTAKSSLITHLHPWKFKMGQKSQNKLTKFARFRTCKF